MYVVSISQKECRDAHRGIRVSDSVSLAVEPGAVTTQEAFPVGLREVAEAGILVIMRSLRIVALAPPRIIRTSP